jgi:hypothetical protein
MLDICYSIVKSKDIDVRVIIFRYSNSSSQLRMTTHCFAIIFLMRNFLFKGFLNKLI